MTRHRLLLSIGMVLAVAFAALHYWTAARITERAEQIAVEASRLAGDQLTADKAREELIAKRLENRLRGFFWQSLLSSLGPVVTALVALAGLLTGLNTYLATREKERADRAAAELKDTLARVAGKEARERMVGIVGLQHFFTAGREEQHLPALAALMAALRIEDNDEVRRAARVVAEAAAASLAPDLLAKVSWQRLKLKGVDLAGRTLDGVDLRDADLEDADLRGARLAGARLDAAVLKGARLDDAVLTGADLSYVDLAGASLRGAHLAGVRITGAKVLKADFSGATFAGTSPGLDELPWDLVKGWRTAKLPEALRQRLESRFGPAPTGPRVLMLMWELPPNVTGGAWTACHHLVRALRRSGADVTVVVPWDAEHLDELPFGIEVPVIGMGLSTPAPSGAYGGGAAFSSYGSASTPYGGPYGGAYGAYGGAYGRAMQQTALDGRAWGGYRPGTGTPLLRLTQAFAQRVQRWIADKDFAVIHAHDWVTWHAARAAAAAQGLPWIAHVHSLEGDRRPSGHDPIIVQLEADGLRAASRIVVPGTATRARAMRDYGLDAARITIVPNALSPTTIAPARMGAFETRRVIFLGRLARQKGPDRFADIAAAVKRSLPDAQFLMFGEGEEASALRRRADVTLRPAIAWEDRADAFAQASALLLPSRSEPFGMVVLEAMQAGVPVLYPSDSGAADALASGIKIDPAATADVAQRLVALLTDPEDWERTARAELTEIAAYPARDHAGPIREIWQALHAPPGGTGKTKGAPA
jgi:glycosyltransferase involved in cell wall biosynthesis